MSDKNIEKKQHAQLLYISQGKSHAQIAEEVGVTERTVFNWVHQYAWDKLRLAAYQAPISIADNLCSEIAELQQTIARRDPGQRFPTPQESITMQRMISCLEKMKKYPSLSQNMQILESFKNYIKPLDSDFAKDLGRYTNRYLSSAAQNNFVPYQIEYGVDAAPPLAPYYDDDEDAELLQVPRSQPDSPFTYSISGIHHARPYIIPLLNICREQVMEELAQSGKDEKPAADISENRYNTANDTETSGSNPEIERNVTDLFSSLSLPGFQTGLNQANQGSDNTINEIKPMPLISGSDEISGNDPEIERNVTNSFSSQSHNHENHGSDEQEELRMQIRQRWHTLFGYLVKEEPDGESDTVLSKAG